MQTGCRPEAAITIHIYIRTISIYARSEGRVYVHAASGGPVISQPLIQPVTMLSLNTLVSGSYSLRVECDTDVVVRHIVLD